MEIIPPVEALFSVESDSLSDEVFEDVEIEIDSKVSKVKLPVVKAITI